MRRLNIPETPPVQVIHNANIVWGLIAAAAVLICALVPVFLHFRSNSANKNNAIAESQAEETVHETDITIEETEITENTPLEDKAPTPEQSVRREKSASGEKPRIAETPRPESSDFLSGDFQSAGTVIASMPEPDTGVRMRGQSGEKPDDVPVPPEQEDKSGIPPGMTFVFENMFANKWLAGIVIPDRIRSIAKNAYAGNPVVIVNIGANVDVHDEAIPGNFAKAYNSYGRAKGIYRRSDNHSEDWKKMGNEQ